jgi:hypothetical protein
MKNLIDIVRNSESSKSKWRGNYLSDEWKNANQLNIVLFGIGLNRSPKCDCLEDLFFMLKSKNINQKYIDKMEQVFKIKKGKLVSSFKFGFHISEQSNDEQIKEALRLDPNLIVYFESYPEDWKVIVGLEKKARKPRTKKEDGKA